MAHRGEGGKKGGKSTLPVERASKRTRRAPRERERESNGLSGEIDMCLCVRACVSGCLSVGWLVGGHVCVGVWCVCPKAYLASEEGLEPDAPSTLHAFKRLPGSSTSTRHFRTTNALCGCSHSAYSVIPAPALPRSVTLLLARSHAPSLPPSLRLHALLAPSSVLTVSPVHTGLELEGSGCQCVSWQVCVRE